MMQTAIRILLVDDESAIRRALRPPLVELGFIVVEASRGEDAVQMLRGGGFDVVLLDVNMPGIGGIETLRRMRALAPRLPILMLTVRDAEEEKVEALELGADDYARADCPYSHGGSQSAGSGTRRRRPYRDRRTTPGTGAAHCHTARQANSPHAQGV